MLKKMMCMTGIAMLITSVFAAGSLANKGYKIKNGNFILPASLKKSLKNGVFYSKNIKGNKTELIYFPKDLKLGETVTFNWEIDDTLFPDNTKLRDIYKNEQEAFKGFVLVFKGWAFHLSGVSHHNHLISLYVVSTKTGKKHAEYMVSVRKKGNKGSFSLFFKDKDTLAWKVETETDKVQGEFDINHNKPIRFKGKAKKRKPPYAFIENKAYTGRLAFGFVRGGNVKKGKSISSVSNFRITDTPVSWANILQATVPKGPDFPKPKNLPKLPLTRTAIRNARSKVVIENLYGEVTQAEVDGLRHWVLNSGVKPGFYGTRHTPYIASWVIKKTKDPKVVERFVDYTYHVLAFRNDKLHKYEELKLKEVTPNLPNRPGVRNGKLVFVSSIASYFDVVWLAACANAIAHMPEIWNLPYRDSGKTYKEVSLEFIKEAKVVFDFLKKHYVNKKNYQFLTPRWVVVNENRGQVAQWNRGIPVITAANEWVEALEAYNLMPKEVKFWDKVNSTYLRFFWKRAFPTKEKGVPALIYSYGTEKVNENTKGEDVGHGAYDHWEISRLFYKKRYPFDVEKMQRMANKLALVMCKGDGGILTRRWGKNMPYNKKAHWLGVEAYYWLANFRPELYDKRYIAYHLTHKRGKFNPGITFQLILLKEEKKLRESKKQPYYVKPAAKFNRTYKISL